MGLPRVRTGETVSFGQNAFVYLSNNIEEACNKRKYVIALGMMLYLLPVVDIVVNKARRQNGDAARITKTSTSVGVLT